MSEIIDINVSQTVEEVTIIATPTNYIVNINKIEAGSAVTSVNGLTGAVVISIPDAQVNSDWNATSGKAQILNKPNIPSISGLATTTYVDTQDGLKVDKIIGKGLSTNDYTTAEQTKISNLSGINTGDETITTIKSKLGITILSGSNTGDQDLSGKLSKSGDIITGDIGNTSTGYFRIASGTTAQRPSTALDGMRRYNTTALRDEFYANGTWQNHARLTGDTFTGAITATNLSGTNTGDETQITILSKLGFTPIKSIIKDTVQGSTITGVTTETLTGTYLIPANTFSANDIMKITSFLAEKTGTAGNCTMRVKVGTTNIFTSSTQIALYQFTSTFLSVNLQRFSIILRNSNLRTFPTLSIVNDFSVFATAYSNVSFNPTIDNYIFTSLQLGSSTDSVFQSNFIMTN